MTEKLESGTASNDASKAASLRGRHFSTGEQMFNPTNAWRLLCSRTGGSIARVTFYRWVQKGKVYSIRLGQRIFIPQAALDEVIGECLRGERF